MATGRSRLSVGRMVRLGVLLILALGCMLSSCSRPAAPTVTAASSSPPAVQPRVGREIRVTCSIQAVRSIKIGVPMIQGQTSTMNLTQLIPNGSFVKEGDLIATFDPTLQMDAAREAQGKFEDLGHQAEQKIAENRANAERRTAELRQAEATLAKAELALSKGPVLSQIERQKNEVRAAGARVHLASLRKSMALREKSEAAALRILELQRDRQKVAMERAQDNIQKLEIRAPLAGMVAYVPTVRGNSLGHPQVGDQLRRSYPLVNIFDRSEMQAVCQAGEPDVLALLARSPASVYLDAYPDLALPAHFVYASPVASSGLGTQVKSFLTVFGIDKPDPHLLPDLSAAVVLKIPDHSAAEGGAP